MDSSTLVVLVHRRLHLVATTVSVFLTIIFLVIGLALIFQPHRWSNTPAYANLLDLMTASTWGVLHLIVGVCMGLSVWVRSRGLSITAHMLGVVILSGWWLGFVIRYATDKGTTVVNVCSWAAYLFLMVLSLVCIDWMNPREFKK